MSSVSLRVISVLFLLLLFFQFIYYVIQYQNGNSTLIGQFAKEEGMRRDRARKHTDITPKQNLHAMGFPGPKQLVG